MGAITPLGHNVADTWEAILNGRSGIGPFTLIERGDHSSAVLCEVKEFEPRDYMDRRDARRRDRYQQLATVAAAEAMAQARLLNGAVDRERIGVIVGTGIGGLSTLIEQEHTRLEKGLQRLNPFAVTMIMPNGAGGMLSIDYGLQGPSTTITTACAAGADAIGHAFRAIRSGELDAALTGGSESAIVSTALGGFEQMRAASSRETETPRPFDRNRDGLVIGEGAAMLVLESLEHATARGAAVLGEIVGYGQTADAHHITAPAKGGRGSARAITAALNDAGLDAADVDYINAHGTGTELNDLYETMAIKQALGPLAYEAAVSSTKSMTGHILGATGAIESVFCALAIRDQVAPATINYETPDPDCDLDYVPNCPRPAPIDVALNHAFGFGGHNAVLAFKRFQV